ncbi:DUF3304 domain-containing protein [Duganella sp. BJB1802]|uniref:DUF3304 domain-containing protein n=1 Tax=Duganella sp. BJB1802 TaxID=2744575 RepID=UPI0015937021|nr:DUF3304 domain-containing protein [Duganella sp. BJB1802]NVD70739.1 DUF3304 domain-containing protein [Duganella sp. BJB1802]
MKRFIHLLAVASALAISGCALHQSRVQPSDRANAQIGIVNHTGSYIYSASVDGAGGGNMESWGEGFANICCTSIPRVWYPGMQVLVRWDMPEGLQHIVKEKTVEVEKYEAPGSIYMHFFPNDEVRVVVSRVAPGNPAYPIRHLGNPDTPPASN